MEIIHFEFNKIYNFPRDLILVLGYFDGVHLGHQALIKRAKESSENIALLTFDNNFRSLLNHQRVSLLTPLSDKVEYFKQLGVKYFIILEFNEIIKNKTKEEFIEEVLKPINPLKIIIGEDYSFGFNGSGNYKDLMKYFDVSVLPFIKIEGIKVGSKKIKELILEGEIEKANKMLNHPYKLSGTVVEGYKNGRKIGFPTANIMPDDDYVTPLEGVYCTYIYIGDSKYKSITSISTHPTINALEKPIIETNVIDFDGNLYGKFVSIEFISYIRPIKKFLNIEQLKAQLILDEEYAKKHLQ